MPEEGVTTIDWLKKKILRRKTNPPEEAPDEDSNRPVKMVQESETAWRVVYADEPKSPPK